MAARPNDDLSLFDPLELQAGERMQKLLCVGRFAEQIVGKQFSNFTHDDWYKLREEVGIARLFHRRETINTNRIAKEIGTSTTGLRARIRRRESQ